MDVSPALKQLASIFEKIYSDIRAQPWATVKTADGDKFLFSLLVNEKETIREYMQVDISDPTKAAVVCYGEKDFEKYDSPLMHVHFEDSKVYEMVKHGSHWEYRNVYDLTMVSDDRQCIFSTVYHSHAMPMGTLVYSDAQKYAVEAAMKIEHPITDYILSGKYILSIVQKRFIGEVNE